MIWGKLNTKSKIVSQLCKKVNADVLKKRAEMKITRIYTYLVLNDITFPTNTVHEYMISQHKQWLFRH